MEIRPKKVNLTLAYDLSRNNLVEGETDSEEFTTDIDLGSTSDYSDFMAYLNNLLSDSDSETNSMNLCFDSKAKKPFETIV